MLAAVGGYRVAAAVVLPLARSRSLRGTRRLRPLLVGAQTGETGKVKGAAVVVGVLHALGEAGVAVVTVVGGAVRVECCRKNGLLLFWPLPLPRKLPPVRERETGLAPATLGVKGDTSCV